MFKHKRGRLAGCLLLVVGLAALTGCSQLSEWYENRPWAESASEQETTAEDESRDETADDESAEVTEDESEEEVTADESEEMTSEDESEESEPEVPGLYERLEALPNDQLCSALLASWSVDNTYDTASESRLPLTDVVGLMNRCVKDTPAANLKEQVAQMAIEGAIGTAAYCEENPDVSQCVENRNRYIEVILPG